MRRLIASFPTAVLFLTLAWGCGGPHRALLDPSVPLHPRSTHYGFSLPYPVAVAPFAADSVSAGVTAERYLPVTLSIDAKGRVTRVATEPPADSALIAPYISYLSALRFEPGLRDGSPTPIDLGIQVQTGTRGDDPIVRFPVDPNRMITHPELYWQAFEKLGVRVPALVSFPSYYYHFGDREKWKDYAIKIFRIDLDSLGEVTAAALARETSTGFADQIRSAIHWAEYSPLVIDGRPMPSTAFLVISLYPMVKYPTEPWHPDIRDGDAPWERSRVQLVPDTIGLLSGPVPKRPWSGEEDNPVYFGPFANLVSARIAVDTDGDSRLTAVTPDFWKALRILNHRSRDIRFFSAIDYAGKEYPYRGLVYLRYVDESNVRVWFDWLGGFDPGLPTQDTVNQ